jgi:hypothetical protein
LALPAIPICSFRAARFSSDQLRPQLIGKARDDLVLHIKPIFYSAIY